MNALVSRAALLAAVVVARAAPAFAAESKIDPADTAFMIAATALVLLMTIPGLALFYGGMVRRKNILATMAQSFAATAVVSLLWFAARLFSLAFTRRRRLARRLRSGLARGNRPRHGQPVRQDHPRDAVHGLSDDLRRHHLRAGRRRGRRPAEVLRLPALLRAVAVPRLCRRARIGCGAAASCRASASSTSPAARWCISTPASPGLVAALMIGARQGYGRENLAPADLSLAVIGAGLLVGRLVRLQRRLGARRPARAPSSPSSPRISRPAPARWCGARSNGTSAASRRCSASISGAVAGLGTITPASGFVLPWQGVADRRARRRRLLLGEHRAQAAPGYDDSLDVFGVHGVGGVLGTLLAGVFATAAVSAGRRADPGVSGLLEGNAGQLARRKRSASS